MTDGPSSYLRFGPPRLLPGFYTLAAHWTGAVQAGFMRATWRKFLLRHEKTPDRQRHNPPEANRKRCLQGMAWLVWYHDGDVVSQFEKRAPAMPRLLCSFLAERKAYKCCNRRKKSPAFRDNASRKGRSTCYSPGA